MIRSQVSPPSVVRNTGAPLKWLKPRNPISSVTKQAQEGNQCTVSVSDAMVGRPVSVQVRPPSWVR